MSAWTQKPHESRQRAMENIAGHFYYIIHNCSQWHYSNLCAFHLSFLVTTLQVLVLLSESGLSKDPDCTFCISFFRREFRRGRDSRVWALGRQSMSVPTSRTLERKKKVLRCKTPKAVSSYSKSPGKKTPKVQHTYCAPATETKLPRHKIGHAHHET